MKFFALLCGVFWLALGAMPTAAQPSVPSRESVAAAMKRATTFMVDEVSTNGGYVWSYLPDFSRRWGEMEAKPSMIWIQDPGTAAMGHLFLDAYHATGDELYYAAAEKTAGALIWGQHPSGGWNYMIDFGGDASLRDWYDTIGENGWAEEFWHYYGNATFDDSGTIEAGKFLLRLYLERRDPKYRRALDKVVDFVLDSQYPVGGWPQRYPLRHEHSRHGLPDYTSFITFNDEVATSNVAFLALIYQALGEERVLDPITRGMNSLLVTQQGRPQPGWSLQHTVDLKPAGARTSEPRSLATHTTAANVNALMDFYQLTGDSKFLARVPEALDWLDSLELPKARQKNGFTHPTFIEVGTNRPLYVYRRGLSARYGGHEVSHEVRDSDGRAWVNRKLDVPALRGRYQTLSAMPLAEATRDSPLLARNHRPLPRYFVTRDIRGSDQNVNVDKERTADAGRIAELVASLNAQGYWPTPLVMTSSPYVEDGPSSGPWTDTSRRAHPLHPTDTSTHVTDRPVIGISTGTYIRNMSMLIQALDASTPTPVR